MGSGWGGWAAKRQGAARGRCRAVMQRPQLRHPPIMMFRILNTWYLFPCTENCTVRQADEW